MRGKGLVGKLIVASFIVSLLLSSGVVYAGTHKNWELVYEHDENGNRISGNLQRLVNDIKNGADVKVMTVAGYGDIYHTKLSFPKTSLLFLQNLVYTSQPDLILL